MELTKMIPFILFICYTIFVYILAGISNLFYVVWLCVFTCFIVGTYLVLPTIFFNEPNYLYIFLSILYTIALSVFISKYSNNTMVTSILVLLLVMVICIIIRFIFGTQIVDYLKLFTTFNFTFPTGSIFNSNINITFI